MSLRAGACGYLTSTLAGHDVMPHGLEAVHATAPPGTQDWANMASCHFPGDPTACSAVEGALVASPVTLQASAALHAAVLSRQPAVYVTPASSSFRQQVTIATERLLWLCRAACLDHWPISAAARSQRHPWLEGTRQVSCPVGHSAVTQLMSHCCSPCLSSPPHCISGPYILQLWGAIPQPSLVSSSLTVQLSQQTRFRLPVRMQQRGRGSLDRSS